MESPHSVNNTGEIFKPAFALPEEPQPTTTGKKRIEYIDSLRGLTMILVVYSHISILFKPATNVTNEFFIIFRMPLFFFLSGFLSYAVYTKKLMIKRIKNRMLKQLLPTLVVFLIFLFFFEKFRVWGFLKVRGFGGYWFTIVVVEYFMTYMAIECAVRKFKINKILQTLIIVALCVGLRSLTAIGFDNFKNPACNITCLYRYLFYCPFFFMGVLAKMHLKWFTNFIANQYCMSLLIAGFIACYFIDFYDIQIVVRSMLGVMIVFRIFQYYEHRFSTATRIGRTLSYIGKYTLEIYLWHYIIIWSLRSMGKTIDFTVINSLWLWQFIVYLSLAIIIVCGCLLMANVAKIAPPIYRLCFGQFK